MELDTLTDEELNALGPVGVWDHVAAVQRFRNRLDAYEARVLACAERMGAAPRAGERRMGPAVAKQAGVGGSEARRRMKTARVVAEHPAGGAALGRGDTNVEQARDVGTARVPEPVRAALLDGAAAQTAEQTRRAVQDAVRDCVADDGTRFVRQRELRGAHRFVDRDGMTNLQIRFDPQTAAGANAAVDAHVQRLWQRDKDAGQTACRRPDQRMADAIAELIAGTGRRASPESDTAHHDAANGEAADAGTQDRRAAGSAPRTVINVVVPHTWLVDSCRTAGVCADGTELSAATLRRLACDADLLPTVLGGAGEVLDVGRAQRTATPTQRRALQARDGGCVVAGCSAPASRCHVHHLQPWQRGGRTDLHAMVLACREHHILIHEGGHRLRRNPDGTWTLHPP